VAALRAAGEEPSHLSSLAHAAAAALARVSGGLIAAIVGACLVVGAVAGWTMRNPDVMALPVEASPALPALWLEPAWNRVPRQSSAEEQLHYALLQAPRDEQARAFLAVPGFFPHSHDQISKAYTQLARIWYRSGNLDGLLALESELSNWKAAKTHEQELVEIVRIAVKLRKADIEGVIEGFKSLSRDKLTDMYDPALIELSMEICADAAIASVRSGTASIERDALQDVQSNLVWQLYRIEVPKANRLISRTVLKRP
jgi:serine/threonine-protein kinase